jgi:hypothetical protein
MPPRRAGPLTCTLPRERRGPTPGAGLQALGGYPLIMRAMLNDDERVWLYMGAFDPPIFRR